ncbi:response regulator transcription factor [Avibacterium paragallinarum]|uniref:response regulator transcription factor n=1 Tax=Avibacterium paragallinarum TaxID=728 RepID=UPI001CC1DF0F|nr:helix-turn-helix transcriptional regulator [Avibacterium paragallinarum]
MKCFLRSLIMLRLYFFLNEIACAFIIKQKNNQWLNVSLQRYKQIFTLMTAQQTQLPFELSKREIEILTLLSSGLSNVEISQQLFISERTVAKHIEHLFQKRKLKIGLAWRCLR